MDRRTFLATSAASAFGGSLASAEPAPIEPAYPALYPDPSEAEDAFELMIGGGLIRVLKPPAWEVFGIGIDRVRSDLATAGLVMPKIRIRDFSKLAAEDYLLIVDGNVIEHGVFPASDWGAARTRRRILARIESVARQQSAWRCLGEEQGKSA